MDVDVLLVCIFFSLGLSLGLLLGFVAEAYQWRHAALTSRKHDSGGRTWHVCPEVDCPSGRGPSDSDEDFYHDFYRGR